MRYDPGPMTRLARTFARPGLATRFAIFWSAAAFSAAPAWGAGSAPPPPQTTDAAMLARVRDAALGSDWAYERLADLTDTIGPRLSGSPQDAAAVAQVAAVMRALGARVSLQAVKVPHWIRGEERAEIVDYSGRPAEPAPKLTQALHLTALGASGATPPQGITARVIVVHDYEELSARAAEVPGNIVLFAARFDQRLADNGHANEAYHQSGQYRFGGPAAAAALGAAAVLVRSVGGADYRLPHTGVTVWKPGQTPIPAAALAAEDAALLERLAARGAVRLSLLLTPKTLPDADSANVIADWPGREKPDEVVIVSGHLDSWDLATGATDDGVGVIGAAAVIEVLRRLDLHPRRTVRFIAWANEESQRRGSKAYAASVATSMATQIAAIESDEGAGRAFGIDASVNKESIARLQPVAATLAPIGAAMLVREDQTLGADISPLQMAGVPGFAPYLDTRHYFDYHHTAADTLDKVDPANLRSQVATMAVLAVFLADMPDPLPRFTPDQ